MPPNLYASITLDSLNDYEFNSNCWLTAQHTLIQVKKHKVIPYKNIGNLISKMELKMSKRIRTAVALSFVMLTGASWFVNAHCIRPQCYNCHAVANNVAEVGTDKWMTAYEKCVCKYYGCL